MHLSKRAESLFGIILFSAAFVASATYGMLKHYKIDTDENIFHILILSCVFLYTILKHKESH